MSALASLRLFSSAARHCPQPLRATLTRARPSTAYGMTVRAMSAEGQVDSELIARMRTKIQTALEAQQVDVADVQGDGRHVEIMVVASSFEGKSAVNRQRMVYKVRPLARLRLAARPSLAPERTH